MSPNTVVQYLSIGGNRKSAASAWSTQSGTLAFGADQNVAIWSPQSAAGVGIQHLLHGHQDQVTAISFLQSSTRPSSEYLLSGSADGQILVWTYECAEWRTSDAVGAHPHAAVNSIATLNGSDIFVSGGSNTDILVWRVIGDKIQLVTHFIPRPKIIPLALAVGTFPTIKPTDAFFIATAGTRNEVQIYTVTGLLSQPKVELQASLKGHEGWIHSLAIKATDDQDFLLASASADKYVRLWKFRYGGKSATKQPSETAVQDSHKSSLTTKTQVISVNDSNYSITFEALLLGHEDWVYSASWNPSNSNNQLLTASADGSLAIWEPDPASGIWVSATRLGEISGQKGATTATGSAGGFWTGLWSPDGETVACLGRTGSWRVWKYNSLTTYWVQTTGISGHTSSANSVSWPVRGEYLLSTSSDQTTRLQAEWRRSSERSWHEFSRPQIHGYDLNCLASTKGHQFVSGADEKLLRVFNEPKDIAAMLKSLCEITEPEGQELPDMAVIPVLGLSNKAVGEEDDSMNEVNGAHDRDYIAPSVLESSLATLREPPTEDVLARHTLWPEFEKLYGHGYEISECAASGNYLATACKASSTEHAVIRLYNTQTWTEIKPPLTAHSLTVTRLAWSSDPDRYLLSVGRDRQWAVFASDDGDDDTSSGKKNGFKLIQCNTKAHTRMILDAAWSPVGGRKFFATAARDKTIKIWHSISQTSTDDKDGSIPNFVEEHIIKRDTSVTAVSFTCNKTEDFAVLAAGEESGRISFHVFDIERQLALVTSVDLCTKDGPSKTVNRLAWRENATAYEQDGVGQQLAVAAADGSVRILAIDIEGLCAKP